MKRATRKNKGLVVNLLSKAFDSNQSVDYIILQDKNRKQRIAALMDYSFELCYQFGEVFLSENSEGCALILYPHQKKTTFGSIWLDIKLIFNSIGIGRIGKALKRESRIKAKQPQMPMVYLWFIGVNPLYQHQQTGSKLLQQVIDHARKLNLPVYLETSTERNLPWYKRSGFRLYDMLDLGYTLHFLTNDPIK